MSEKQKRWDEMTDEEKKEFLKISKEEGWRKEWHDTLRIGGVVDGPSWDDLDDEKKEKFKKSVREYNKEMRDFGNSLSEQ